MKHFGNALLLFAACAWAFEALVQFWGRPQFPVIAGLMLFVLALGVAATRWKAQ